MSVCVFIVATEESSAGQCVWHVLDLQTGGAWPDAGEAGEDWEATGGHREGGQGQGRGTGRPHSPHFLHC